MLFNSLHYLIFFPLVVTGFFLLPNRARWAWLLLASCWFYMAFIPVYIFVLGGIIVIDYLAGILIAGTTGGRRAAWLLTSIGANVGVLAVFKYYNFINGNVKGVFSILGWQYAIPSLALLLPIGLSFHTFQAMSYTIEVYRGNQQPERHFGHYALYVMFFPQLVAGPIERPQSLLPQFRLEHRVEYDRIAAALQLIAWGFFKKVVIADRLAIYVREVYDNPRAYTGLPLIVATIFFAFQIYCDFSGYSDIAIGSARVLGFNLRDNFRRPYLSRGVAEFWTRWHISLSTWFRDYVYIPLGGGRRKLPRVYANLMVTFLLSGLWHGANWTFVAWGALNGFYLVFGRITRPARDALLKAVRLDRARRPIAVMQTLATFGLICIGWVFFRAYSISDSFYIITHFFRWNGANAALPAFGRVNFLLSLSLIVLLVGIEIVEEQTGGIRQRIAKLPEPVRWAGTYALCLATLIFGIFAGRQAFIYFQF